VIVALRAGGSDPLFCSASVPATAEYNERLLYVGPDHTGLELEILAIEQPDRLLVIHVMPTEWRNR
jgi:hypothetical protein